MPGFWTGGAGAYEKALREQYEAARATLQAQLDQTDEPSERQPILNEMEELKKEYEERMDGIGRCLFGSQ
jgi:hypothetical protein